jgi:hypothetical protein
VLDCLERPILGAEREPILPLMTHSGS